MILNSQREPYTEDRWATTFFQSLLDESLTPDEFEDAVHKHWNARQVVVAAPRTTDWLSGIIRALSREAEVGYAVADPDLKFQSHWLVGKTDKPGAIHIRAPAEKTSSPLLSELNRPMHMHDTGRLNLITSGEAIFYFQQRDKRGRKVVVKCPVGVGDLIFWPSWTPHTFNALNGFSVLSSMPLYVSPEEDGYTVRLPDDPRNMDEHLLISLSDYLARDHELRPLSSAI